MATKSFSDAHAQLYGAQGNSSPSAGTPGGLSPFQQAHSDLIQQHTNLKPIATPMPTKQVAPQTKQQPVQNSDPFADFLGQVYKGAVGEIGSILHPQPSAVAQAPKVNPSVKLPLGMKLSLTDAPKAAQSAQMTITPQSIQSQKQSSTTNQKVSGMVNNTFHGTLDQLQGVFSDPLNTKNLPDLMKDPKKVVTDFLNTVPEAYNKETEQVNKLKTTLHNPNATTSQKAGEVLKAVSAQANFIFSPVSAIFNAADKVPVIGTLSKLLTAPFSAIGEGGTAVSNKIVDALPITQQAKENLKPGMGEIFALAGQLALGHITTIEAGKKAALVDKFGAKDAATIITQAEKLAKEKTVEPGTYAPADLRNQVFQKKIEATPHGKEILKTTLEAEAAGKHIVIKTPTIDTFDNNIDEYRRFGGKTDGASTENAALRDITAVMDHPEVVAHTKEKVKTAIQSGELVPDENGMITLYRGGKPSEHNKLVSAAYTPDIAKQFVKEGEPIQEFKVKPSDIKAFIGKAEKEVLVKKENLPVVSDVAQPPIHDTTAKIPETKTEELPKAVATKLKEAKVTPQEPVGTGKQKESRAYKRFVEHLETNDPELFNKVKDDPKLLYNTVNQKYDFENAAKIVEEDPQKAYNIAMQRTAAPVGQRWESVNQLLADRAMKEGNIGMMKELEQHRSQQLTREGQSIVAERGRFDDNSPHTYIKKVLDERLKRLGGNGITSTIDTAIKTGKVKIESAKERGIAKIDAAVARAQQFTKKERSKIDFAQKLLDELTCK